MSVTFFVFYILAVFTFVPILKMYIVSFKLSNHDNAEDYAAIKYGKPFCYITKVKPLLMIQLLNYLVQLLRYANLHMHFYRDLLVKGT